MKTKTKRSEVFPLDTKHAKILKAVAAEAECTPNHALKWAVRTLADKRGISLKRFEKMKKREDDDPGEEAYREHTAVN